MAEARYKVEIKLTEDMLGTVGLDKNVYSTYIIDKRLEDLDKQLRVGEINELDYKERAGNAAAELASVREEKGKTGFHRDEKGRPFIFDYMVRGFFKSACEAMRNVEDSASSTLKAYKKRIDQHAFPTSRRIYFELLDPTAQLGELQRPLRASTAQGERVALAASEVVPAGSKLCFGLRILNDKIITPEMIYEWLDYGELMGLGQWRSGGYGRFIYTISPA